MTFSGRRKIDSTIPTEGPGVDNRRNGGSFDLPSPTVRDTDKTAILRYALRKLPEDRREMVVLSQYHQLTPDEIAELLDIDVPAARVRVHRAMMELRDLYRTLSG